MLRLALVLPFAVALMLSDVIDLTKLSIPSTSIPWNLIISRYNNKNENENDNTVTIKEFNIPEDKFDAVHEILSTKTSWYKKDRLLALTGI